jgi:hypothetical protein
MRILRPLALVLLAIAAPAVSETLVETRYWPAELAGRLDLADLRDNEFFADLDPINDLGLEEDDTYEARVSFRPSRGWVARLAWLPLSFKGDVTIDGMIGAIPISPRVQTSLEIDYARAGLAWQLVATRDGRFRLGPMIEAKGFRGEAAIGVDNPILPLVETTRFETALASAGLLLDAEPTPRVHVFAEWTTLVDTGKGDLRDAEAGVRFLATDWITLTLGYRMIEIDISDGVDLLQVDIDSVFLGADFRF